MAKLKFYYSTMRAGKSTLALQMNDNFKIVDKMGLMFTMGDRSGEGQITSRTGLSYPAFNLKRVDDIYEVVKKIGGNFDYLILDESQFYSEKQIEQLVDIVDDLDIDVYCFGLKSDFRGKLFESSKRLLEVADEISEIQVKALCWCGRKATYNTRTVDGYKIVYGDVIVIGDEEYEVLCREHYNKGITKRVAIEEELI